MRTFRMCLKFITLALAFILLLLSLAATSAQTLETSLDIQYYVGDIVWSPDGNLIAVSGTDGVRIYSDELQEFAHFQRDMTYLNGALSWSPDSTLLATVGNGSILIWHRDPNGDFTLEPTLNVEGFLQVLVAWSPDGSRLASQDVRVCSPTAEFCLSRGLVRIWNTTSWTLERTLPREYSYNASTYPPRRQPDPFALEWSADSTSIVAAGYDEASYGDGVFVVDAFTGQVINVVRGVESVLGFDLHPNGLLVRSDGAIVGVYDVHAQRFLFSFFEGISEAEALSWSPDGTRLLFMNDGRAEIWDFGTGQPIAFLPFSYELDWSPDGTRIVAWGTNPDNDSRALKIWDVSDLPSVAGTPTLTPYPTFVASATPTPTLTLTATPTPAQ